MSLPGRAGMGFSFGRTWNLNRSKTFAMSRNPATGDNRLSSDTIEAFSHMGAGWSSDIPYLLFNTSSGTEQMFLFFGGSACRIDRNGIETGIDLLKSNLQGYDLLDKGSIITTIMVLFKNEKSKNRRT